MAYLLARPQLIVLEPVTCEEGSLLGSPDCTLQHRSMTADVAYLLAGSQLVVLEHQCGGVHSRLYTCSP